MKLKSKNVSYPAPEHGIVTYENSYYSRPSGFEKIRVRIQELRDDIFDHGLRSFSHDNGQTWPESQPFCMSEKRTDGMLRRMETGGFVDPVNHRLLQLSIEGILRNDISTDGLTAFFLKYRVSSDGGRTVDVEDQVIEKGNYTPSHPLEYQWVGKNGICFGAGESVLRSRKGPLIVATQLFPLGPDGELYNPGGGWYWCEVLILFGTWQSDGRIEWVSGPRIQIDPSLSTEGVFEPTLARMPDGRILMVMRGSNGGERDPNYAMPGLKWHSVSSDEGVTWSSPAPWRYSDGSPFYSPCSISQMLAHSNGKFYWFGNISPQNTQGNLPRYPLVGGEIDPLSFGLIKESVCEIDTLQPGEHPSLRLSNFSVHEDRANGDFIIQMTRMFYEENNHVIWGDAYLYRVEP